MRWKFVMDWFDPNAGLTQEQRVLKLFKENSEVPLPELLKECPATYRRVLDDLRKKGHVINNRTEYFYYRSKDGRIVSTKTVSKYTYLGNANEALDLQTVGR